MAAKKAVVGLSGGVDSSVAALLLLERGYEVTGVFMKNWEEKDENGVCTSTQDRADALLVAQKLGIPCYTVNFTEEYMERVFSIFLSEYRQNRTPNPDILCNTEIKFKAFLELAMGMDADVLATGHYARLEREGGRIKLMRAADRAKDQTYFLAGLDGEQLERALFPIGDMQKSEVRRIASEAGLATAAKKDSTGVCFIGERNFKQFLMGFLPAKPGDIVDLTGRVLGRHDGLMYYTMGQRRGLGIGGKDFGTGESWFVVGKDLAGNRLIVQQGEHEELFFTSLTCNKLHMISRAKPTESFRCTAKTRYREPDRLVTVHPAGEGCVIEFDEPERAVTLGQWAVLYDGEECLGGGEIDDAVRKKALPAEFNIR